MEDGIINFVPAAFPQTDRALGAMASAEIKLSSLCHVPHNGKSLLGEKKVLHKKWRNVHVADHKEHDLFMP